MRNFMVGYAVLGLLATGAMAPASAHFSAVQPVGQSYGVQRADWDNCGPRCQEQRREAHERERAHERWEAQHRRLEEHRDFDQRR
jgi:hypothetical protein